MMKNFMDKIAVSRTIKKEGFRYFEEPISELERGGE
jgi:hypothetical protein